MRIKGGLLPRPGKMLSVFYLTALSLWGSWGGCWILRSVPYRQSNNAPPPNKLYNKNTENQVSSGNVAFLCLSSACVLSPVHLSVLSLMLHRWGSFPLTLQANALFTPPHLTQPLLHKPRLSLAFRRSVERSVVTGLGSERSDREEVEVTGCGMKEKRENSKGGVDSLPVWLTEPTVSVLFKLSSLSRALGPVSTKHQLLSIKGSLLLQKRGFSLKMCESLAAKKMDYRTSSSPPRRGGGPSCQTSAISGFCSVQPDTKSICGDAQLHVHLLI